MGKHKHKSSRRRRSSSRDRSASSRSPSSDSSYKGRRGGRRSGRRRRDNRDRHGDSGQSSRGREKSADADENDDRKRLKVEEIERERNREAIRERGRQWVVVDDEDKNMDGDEGTDDLSGKMGETDSKKSRKKNTGKSRKRSRSPDRKKLRKRSRHSHRHYSSSNESSDFSSDSYSSYESHRHHSKRRHKKSKKKDKKSSSKKKNKDAKEAPSISATIMGTFGKYGIIKESDFYRMQRTFEVWMGEVKGIPSFTGAKWEAMEYFKEFCEDFNTATMPHIKYYNYDKWEMDEYRRKQADLHSSKSSAQSDEARHREMKKIEQEKLRQEDLARIRAGMNKEKIEEMKQQEFLKCELNVAYKTGDIEKRKKLQRKLEPEDPRMKITAAHPWAK